MDLGQTDLGLGGGTPQLGEPLAIEFANTHYAVRRRVCEGIGTPGHLEAWMRENAAMLGPEALHCHVDETELPGFWALRAAIRGLCRACVDRHPGDDDQVEVLNAAAAAATRWPRLNRSGIDYSVSERTDSAGLVAVLAAIARDAIALIGGSARTRIRVCPGPGCVLFFVKDHPRREWCSAACGNRARAARHYQRHRPR